jgi:EF hand domain-containing protein
MEKNMKLAIVTSVAVLLSAGYALAGAGAPVPEGSQTPPPSGRPSAPLDDAACQDVWKMAAPSGDTLAKDKAVPFVVNFEMVDTDKDGKISQSEFQAGCGAGWIQKPDASTVNDMKGTKP